MGKYEYLITLLIYLRSATKFQKVRDIEKVSVGLLLSSNKNENGFKIKIKIKKERLLEMEHKKVDKEVRGNG